MIVLRLGGFLTVFLCTLALGVGGCISGSSGGSTTSVFTSIGGTLSGRVTASSTLAAGSSSRADLRALFNVATAAVWLQEHPEIRAVTAADGTFLLENVPFGTNRVVANLKTGDYKTFKTRSEPIAVSPDNPAQSVGQLAVEFAQNRVRIILRDAEGRPVPNATLTLWGEPCEVDGNGVYLSPPLPDSELLEEILIVAAGGLATGTIVAPFTGNGEATVVQTLTAPTARNKAPNVWLTSFKEPADKINSGEVVKLWAVYLDENTEDLDPMKVTWRWDGGTLASGTTPIPEDLKRRIPRVDWSVSRVVPVEWTAPSEPQLYKVEVVVADPGGLDGQAQHPLNVQLTDADSPSLPPANQPPVVAIVASTTVYGGHSLALAVRVNDANLDLVFTEWSVSPVGGTFFISNAETTVWTAPTATGAYEIRCRVTEIREDPLSVVATFAVFVLDNPIIVRPGMIAGHVLDERTRQPIPQAVVAIAWTNVYTIADDAGYFQFVNLAPGTYVLIATKNGYQARTYPDIVVPAS